MDNRGANTLQEISSQPAAWAEAVAVVKGLKSDLQALSIKDYDEIVYTGCGSTYYLSLAAAALNQALTGQVSRGFPASELLFYPDSIYSSGGRTLLVAVSRSGTTTETLRAVEAFQKTGSGDIVTVTNYPDSPLATMGKLNVLLPAGRETSIAQTRSFASMYVACTAISAVFGQDDALLESLGGLEPVGKDILARGEGLARKWGENSDLNQVFFLGSGPNYGLASEASLKMKEMSLTISEPFRFMEFRHGPMSMVTPQTLVVGLVSDSVRDQETAVLNEMRDLGGNILSLAESDADVAFGSGLPEAARGVLYLPTLQLMAFYRSISKGLDPDKPTNLSKVIELDLP